MKPWKLLMYWITPIIMAVYALVSLLMTEEKNAPYWIGFAFMLLAFVIEETVILRFTHKRDAAFPLDLTVFLVPALYIGAVAIVNGLFRSAFRVGYLPLFCIHLVCLAVFVVIFLLIAQAKRAISRQHTRANQKLAQVQSMVNALEQIKIKLLALPEAQRKTAVKTVESLQEELRFSDFSAHLDTMETDVQILEKANRLSAEAENLVQLQTEGCAAFDAAATELRQLIQMRNMQIRSFDNGI